MHNTVRRAPWMTWASVRAAPLKMTSISRRACGEAQRRARRGRRPSWTSSCNSPVEIHLRCAANDSAAGTYRALVKTLPGGSTKDRSSRSPGLPASSRPEARCRRITARPAVTAGRGCRRAGSGLVAEPQQAGQFNSPGRCQPPCGRRAPAAVQPLRRRRPVDEAPCAGTVPPSRRVRLTGTSAEPGGGSASTLPTALEEGSQRSRQGCGRRASRWPWGSVLVWSIETSTQQPALPALADVPSKASPVDGARVGSRLPSYTIPVADQQGRSGLTRASVVGKECWCSRGGRSRA